MSASPHHPGDLSRSRRTLPPRSPLIAAALLCLASLALTVPARADLFDWSEGSGLFSNGFNWFNTTTNTMHAGPPGTDDIATLCSGCTVTGDGGSVAALQGFGDTIFTVTAPFSAELVLPGGMTVGGSALLSAGSITGSLLRIAGGNVTTVGITHTGPSITAGGVLHVSGEADDLSGIVDGTNSHLTIDGDASDLNFLISAGGRIDVVANLTNGLDRTLALEDVSSKLTAANLVVESGFLDVAGGAAVEIGQGIFVSAGSDQPPSGGLWTDAGTSVSAGLGLFIDGSGIAMQNGAHFEGLGVSLLGGTAPGSLQVQGAGTTVVLGANGAIVGQTGASALTMGTGANLTTAGDAKVGVEALANGSWQITGAGTTAALTGDLVVGELAQSTGTVSLTNGGALQLAKSALVGKSGKGTLSVGSGAQVALTAAASNRLALGVNQGANGTLNLSGTGSTVTTNGRPMAIGEIGTGSVAIGPGGALSTGSATIGGALGSLGSVSLGADASWTANGPVAVGGNSLFPGAGIVQVGPGALVRATTELGIFLLGKVVLGGGKVVVGSAAADATNSLRVTPNGTLSATAPSRARSSSRPAARSRPGTRSDGSPSTARTRSVPAVRSPSRSASTPAPWSKRIGSRSPGPPSSTAGSW